MQNKNCESCMMPLAKDTGHRENEKYCSHCFHDGKLVGEGSDLKTFQKCSYDAMVAAGTSKFIAKIYAWMIRFAPRWKDKK